MKTQFQIADERMQLNYDGILGSDFLLKYETIIDLNKMTISAILPLWHNMYEVDERHMFERSHQHINKTVKTEELIYFKNGIKPLADTIRKKTKILQTHISRLELLKTNSCVQSKNIQ